MDDAKEKANELISLRDSFRQENFKDFSRPKKGRVIAEQIMNSVAYLPEEVFIKLKEVMSNINREISVYEWGLYMQAYKMCMKGDTLAFEKLGNRAFGIATTEDNIIQKFEMPDVTPEFLDKIAKRIEEKY